MRSALWFHYITRKVHFPTTMPYLLPVVLAVLIPLNAISAVEWSFNLPYYLLLGGAETSVDQPFREFVTEYGYPLEVHTDVQTEDGYLLTMFRIPYGIKNNSHVKDKPVAFLMHGLLSSSEDYVVLGPEKSLGFILADRGYDVWLGNTRGSLHSRKHVKFDPTWNGKFWEFSYHEAGYYDLATMVDYISSITKQEQLYYFGHSEGATVFFVLTSTRPEYNKRFKFMVGLAPAVFLTHSKSLLLKFFSISDIINNLILKLGINELARLRVYTLLAKTICKVKGIPMLLCKEVHFYNFGGISDHFNTSLTPKVMRYEYAGASLRQGLQYAQGFKSGRFRQYDHGKKQNLKIYGSEQPPDYNLTKVLVSIAYLYGEHDELVVVKDQNHAIQQFSKIHPYKLPNKKMTHMDMVLADDIKQMAYNKAFKWMEKA